ncbi:hypothetical protein C8R28_10508 [Nitrosomonas ureae]|uniref:Uncharacterized protein n=1 Tax=Nitrosomonas ureae TaxID=44577 RepID=A0A2T5I6K4_9PROT|nr:hypothetical protein C8R28_10508 [Nitrosomonas ureae]
MKVSSNKNNPLDKNRAEERRSQLQDYFGNSANILHGKINLDEFRNYILSLFFTNIYLRELNALLIPD